MYSYKMYLPGRDFVLFSSSDLPTSRPASSHRDQNRPSTVARIQLPSRRDTFHGCEVALGLTPLASGSEDPASWHRPSRVRGPIH